VIPILAPADMDSGPGPDVGAVETGTEFAPELILPPQRGMGVAGRVT
jgi:hypothetical protein